MPRQRQNVISVLHGLFTTIGIHCFMFSINKKQECIPVGTGRSLTVCCSLLPGGVPGPGRCLVWGGAWSGGLPSPGGLPGPGGVCSRRGGRVPGLGGCLLLGGVCSGGCLLWGGGSQHALRQTPLPPCGQTHACKNITLAQLRCGR